MLSVYVDDFKMAGPRENLAKGWALLREKVVIEDPTEVGLYLGCQQRIHDVQARGVNYRVMEYNIEPFLGQHIEKYLNCPGSIPLRNAATPYC